MNPSLILTKILLEVRRRFLWIHSAAGLAWGVATAAIVVLLGVWLDLIFEFTPFARIAATVFASVAALAAFGWLIGRAARRSRLPRLAGSLDTLSGATGQIQSGLDLALIPVRNPTKDEPLTRGLAELAITRAGELARRVSKSQAVSTRPISRSCSALAGVGVVMGALVLLLPRMSATEWLRFIDPFGDHPPYSAIQFTVTPAGARVVYGKGLDVDVATQGGAVDQVELVLVHPIASTDRREEVLPMFPVPGGGWRASLTDITEPLSYFARARRARSPRYDVTLVTVPLIESVDFRIVAPAYTRTPIYEGGLPRTGISGLRGTVVEVRAHSNRPLQGGLLTLVDSTGRKTQPLAAANSADQSATGQFTIDRSCRLEVRVTDVDGETSTDCTTASVTLISDERPFVRLMEPRQMSLAVPDAVVPVVIAAEDDFGIARSELYRSLNGSPFSPMNVRVPAPPAKQVYETVLFPFSTYGLSPGDEVKVFARAADNDPAAAGGKGSESSVSVIRIISQADLDRLQRSRDGLTMLLSKYQEAQRRMESLQDEIEQLQKKVAEQPADKPLDEQLRKQMEELNKRFAEESEALRKLADRALPYDLDKQLSPRLRKLADELAHLSKTSKLGGPKGLSAAEAKKQLEAALKAIKQNRGQLDQDVMAPVQFVAAIVPLMKDSSRFIELYQHQRDLADRLSSFKDKDRADDPALKARMRDLEEEQRGLQKELESLLDDIEEHASRLPDDPSVKALRETAQKFAADLRASAAGEAMSAAATALGEYSGRTAHTEAKRAADILEKFIHRCNGMGQGCKNCLPKFSPTLGECMSQTCQQLMAGMNFGQGNGFGFGAGGGYSARQGSLDNVGLYGTLPTFSSSEAKAGSGSDRHALGMMRDRGKDRMADPRDAFHVPSAGKQRASTETAVPPAYRQRASRYFQRIADEVGDR
jgi:peptidoglycan hydrolase CwlO-like protein